MLQQLVNSIIQKENDINIIVAIEKSIKSY